MNKQILSYSFKLHGHDENLLNHQKAVEFVVLNGKSDCLYDLSMEILGTPEADAVIDRIRNIK